MDFNEFLQSGIFAVTGKPGAGKSYFSTRVILAEIAGENRNIITNVPVNREELRKKADKDFYIYELETFTNNAFFFTQRGDYSYQLEQGGQESVDFSKYLKDDDNGCLYIIDEAHLYFNSRNWKSMQQATLSFFTFIRHCGDTLIYLTQKFSDVDAQLRGKTQTFNLIRNLSKERLGWLKRGSGFRLYQYLREKDIENYDNATQDFSYSFDLAIAKCYATSLFNKGRDKHFKIKGITFKQMMIFLFLLLGVAVWWVYDGGFMKVINLVVPQVETMVDKTVPKSVHVKDEKSALPVFSDGTPFLPYENPSSIFDGDRFQMLNSTSASQLDGLVFGVVRKLKLSFYVEKQSSDKSTGLNFSVLWGAYQDAAVGGALAVVGSSATFETPVFNGFMSYIRDNQDGSTLKEVDLVLKESVPCTFSQGYEIPIARTIATQGVSTTNYDYRKVGFDLILIMEELRNREMIKVTIQNTQVLDRTSEVASMIHFSSENVYDVSIGKTYEIAQFESIVTEKSKKFLSKKEIETTVNNRVFMSYGE